MTSYDMTSPCPKCPFRSDITPFLRPDRVEEIAESLVRAEFPCHQTLDYSNDSEGARTPKTAHCAGALILLEKLEQPSQMMRICERLGIYDRSKLDMAAPVFDSFEDMIAAARFTDRKPRRGRG